MLRISKVLTCLPRLSPKNMYFRYLSPPQSLRPAVYSRSPSLSRPNGVFALTMQFVFEIVFLFFLVDTCISQDKYTAAVLEHVTIFTESSVPHDRSAALQVMMKNLHVYAERAEEASKGGAVIIVFPEDGLYGFQFTRETILPYLEDIPDPEVLEKPWNPCLEPKRFGNLTEVLQVLSCIAQNHSIAVVANMGDVKYCNETDPNCPGDGRYQFNTDVAFDTDGTLLAKYHKQHLFGEKQFNTPLKCEYVTFETSFKVRFGVFTCFDILFADPAITLVEKYGVHNIVFPTAWINSLPLLTAVQIQQAWSRATCTNLLAANQHFLFAKMYGSGIYSCGNTNAYVYDSTSPHGHLLIATLPKLKRSNFQLPRNLSGDTLPRAALPSRERNVFQNSKNNYVFNGTMFHDMYTFVKLEVAQGHVTACNKDLCCQAKYTTSMESSLSDTYVLGAFSGHHSPDGFFLQVCALIKCKGSKDKSCGLATKTSSTLFQSIALAGNFSSKTTVFPELLGDGVQLFPSSMMNFSGNGMTVDSLNKPLVSAVLFGRLYSQDKEMHPSTLLDKFQEDRQIYSHQGT